ncbi:hypothetical protein N7527_004841 [Penicillium freii]|nr:hypothetical protein N7527_004841 [Penicillium freii]
MFIVSIDMSGHQLGRFHLRRSLNIAGVDASDVGKTAINEANNVAKDGSTAVIYATAAAETAVSQVSDKVQSLSDEIKSNLPGYYSVGLWGYCQGQKNVASYTNCSHPSTSFSFDLLGIFGSMSTAIEDILPEKITKILAVNHYVSRWSILAYILGFVATFLAVVIGITTMIIPWGKILLTVLSLSATIFITGASIGVTVIYGLMAGALGTNANFGAHMFTATWLAVAFSFAAFLTWLIEMFCCCI